MIRPVLLTAVFFSSTTIASEYTANEVLRFCSDHSKVTEQIMLNLPQLKQGDSRCYQ